MANKSIHFYIIYEVKEPMVKDGIKNEKRQYYCFHGF